MAIPTTRLRALKALIMGHDRIVLPCSSTKLKRQAPAKEFYCGSGYFLHQKKLADISGIPWGILSTRYGYVSPSTLVDPYDLIWSKKVKNDNPCMRSKDIPIASEEQRLFAAGTVMGFVENGEKVLSFCSLNYARYIPEDKVTYFNAEAAKVFEARQKGIQFLVKTLYDLKENWHAL